LDWSLEPKFGDASVSKIAIFRGDKINFKYPIDGGSARNLFEMANEDSYEKCNFQDATAVADVEEVFIGHTITFDEAGIFFFSCGISCTDYSEEASERQTDNFTLDNATSCHCKIGRKLQVQVKHASEGTRCHNHTQESSAGNSTSLSCADGEVLVSTISNADYGAMDETECAEFCSTSSALPSMEGVELGSCSAKGYTYNPVTLTLKPPGSSVDVEVRVTSFEDASTCHCHFYEEIHCPDGDGDEDTLYDEHIEEIEQYCTGILDGSEEYCPYKCFQPMEVLHLHYLECESREIDPTYMAVNATEKCHTAATAPSGVECPVVDPGKGQQTSSATQVALSMFLIGLSLFLM
jgi:hypothetical protein